MAAVVSSLGSAFTTVAGDKTVTATPAVGDLIVVCVAVTNANTSLILVSDNNPDGNGQYTRISTAGAQARAGVDEMVFYVRNAVIGASGAASTIFTMDTTTNTVTTTGGGLQVFKVTGMTRSGSSAVKQSGSQSNGAAAATPTVALGVAALTGNALLGAVLNATNPATMTPRGTPVWTESIDVGYITPTTGLETMFINSGETGSSIAWGGTSATAFGAAVLELDTSAAATVSLLPTWMGASPPTILPLLCR